MVRQYVISQCFGGFLTNWTDEIISAPNQRHQTTEKTRWQRAANRWSQNANYSCTTVLTSATVGIKATLTPLTKLVIILIKEHAMKFFVANPHKLQAQDKELNEASHYGLQKKVLLLISWMWIRSTVCTWNPISQDPVVGRWHRYPTLRYHLPCIKSYCNLRKPSVPLLYRYTTQL